MHNMDVLPCSGSLATGGNNDLYGLQGDRKTMHHLTCPIAYTQVFFIPRNLWCNP